MTTNTATAVTRLFLIGDSPRSRPPAGTDSPAVRRYRLARLRLDPVAEQTDRAARHAHLRRSHD